MSPVKPSATDRSRWTIQRCDSFEEMRRLHLKEWQMAGESARLQAAWELVHDYWVGMKGMDPNELRLQRSVTNIQRI